MASIKNVPPPAEKGLKPGAEVHWSWISWNPDVAEITGTIARRDV
jgi:hypothetical protein